MRHWEGRWRRVEGGGGGHGKGAYFSQALGDWSTSRSITMSPREVSSSALMEICGRVSGQQVAVLCRSCFGQKTKVEVGGSTELGPITACLSEELSLVQLLSFLWTLYLDLLFSLSLSFCNSLHFVLFFFFSLLSFFFLHADHSAVWLYSNRWESFRSTSAGADDRPGACTTLLINRAAYPSEGPRWICTPLGVLGQWSTGRECDAPYQGGDLSSPLFGAGSPLSVFLTGRR